MLCSICWQALQLRLPQPMAMLDHLVRAYPRHLRDVADENLMSPSVELCPKTLCPGGHHTRRVASLHPGLEFLPIKVSHSGSVASRSRGGVYWSRKM